MAGRKKTFPCGHTGKGQYCHRCAQEQAATQDQRQQRQQRAARRAAEKEAWRRTFAADPVDLRGLPSRTLVLKARQILDHVAQSGDYTAFRGKRLGHDRTIISVPLGRDHRILFRDGEAGPQPMEVMTHQQYNTTKPGA